MKPTENNKQEMKKNAAPQPTLEEMYRGFADDLAECENCPAKLGCAPYTRAAVMSLYLRDLQNARKQNLSPDAGLDDDADEWEDDESVPHPMDELNDAVYDLVDDLFRVTDKIAEARKYLERLDGLAEMSLDYLSAIGVPQLSPED
ncbi:MAG: hypothetical protein IKP72_01970 [Clostridia bacterium]|nr:hypothetical protein [Clostridia bacterium]MBR4331426.1 hypothetical protein [Clostridia bacterium]